MVQLKKGKVPDDKFIKSELNRGILIEREHTDDLSIAKQIAKAHLIENPFYYTYLYHMEKNMDKNKNSDKQIAKHLLNR